MKLAFASLALAACSHHPNQTTGDAQKPLHDAGVFLDGFVFMDAPPNVPPMITVSGNVSAQGLNNSTPVKNAAVGVYRSSADTTPLAIGTSDAQGNYSIQVATGGAPIDGFVKSSATGYLDTYIYPAGAMDADVGSADANMVTQGNFNLLATFAGATQDGDKGLVVIEVIDQHQQTIGGATVVSVAASGAYRYDDASSGLPSSSATATSSDGVGYLFDVPGSVTVSAMKAGTTFKPHVVNARPNAFTTTIVSE
jgi:hypothetical protein